MRKTLSLLLCGFFFPGLMLAEDATFDSNGVKIRYVTEGKGEAVVLLHGWMGDAGSWGKDLFGNVKLTPLPGFMLISMDCRGHGESDKPHDVTKYGVEMALDVVRLLDHLKVDKAHLIGYSSGGFIAGKVVGMHPERVRSVIYGGQAPVVKELIKPGDFSECETFAKAVEEGKGLGSYVMMIAPADRPKPTPKQADAVAKFMFGGKDVKGYAAAGSSFHQLAITEEELKKSNAPVLFIHGGNESAHVKNRVAKVKPLIPQAEHKVVEGGDHVTTMIKPEFGKTLVEFLQRHQGK